MNPHQCEYFACSGSSKPSEREIETEHLPFRFRIENVPSNGHVSALVEFTTDTGIVAKPGESLSLVTLPTEPCSTERPNAGGGTGLSGTRGRPNRKRGCNGQSVSRARVTPLKESSRYCWQGFKLFSMPKAKRNDRRALAEGEARVPLEVLCLALSLPLSFSPSGTGTGTGTVQDPVLVPVPEQELYDS